MTTHTTSTASNGHSSAARRKTMLAGRLHFDPRRFTVEEVPMPAPGRGEVLVAVKAAGVCLSDVHFIDGSLSSPFNRNPAVTLGHEFAGAIEAIGPDVGRLRRSAWAACWCS
jgi:D-arabinose 1-dehydrogenase-like Zn-dependent alcohol dehydrogenase